MNDGDDGRARLAPLPDRCIDGDGDGDASFGVSSETTLNLFVQPACLPRFLVHLTSHVSFPWRVTPRGTVEGID